MTRKGDSFVPKLNYYQTYEDNVSGHVTWKTVVWKSKIYCVYFYVCVSVSVSVSLSYVCVSIYVFVFMCLWICVFEPGTIGLCWPPPIVPSWPMGIVHLSMAAPVHNARRTQYFSRGASTSWLRSMFLFRFLSKLHVLDPPLTKLVHYIPL